MKILILTIFIALSSCCVNRADAISKALEWVRDAIPYSQTEYHEGYRKDCSGLASCAWRLKKPGYTTKTFIPNNACVNTTKE